MNSGFRNAETKQARPRGQRGARRWWMSPRVLGGMATLSTVFTVGAMYLVFTSRTYGWKVTSRLIGKNMHHTSPLFGRPEKVRPGTARLTEPDLQKSGMWGNVSRKAGLMKAIAQKQSCPGDCTTGCIEVCKNLTLPQITSDRRAPTTTTPSPKTDHAMELICVLRAARMHLWPKSYQCTRYIYVRPNGWAYDAYGPRGIKSYTADSPPLIADHMFNRARSKYPYAFWYLGFDVFYRDDYSRFQDFNEDIINLLQEEQISDYLKRSSFHGLALHNVPLRSKRDSERLVELGKIIEDFLGTSWKYLYSAMLYENFTSDYSFLEPLKDLIRPDTYFGINIGSIHSPAYELDENFPHSISRTQLPKTMDSINDIRDAFSWENNICVSITGTMYVQRKRKGVRHALISRLQIFTDLNFIEPNGDYKVLDNPDREIYEEDLNWKTTAYVYDIIYDTNITMSKKVEDVLKHSSASPGQPNRRCIIFGDIGDDSLEATLSGGNFSHTWKRHDLLGSVITAIETENGAKLWPAEYYQE